MPFLFRCFSLCFFFGLCEPVSDPAFPLVKTAVAILIHSAENDELFDKNVGLLFFDGDPMLVVDGDTGDSFLLLLPFFLFSGDFFSTLFAGGDRGGEAPINSVTYFCFSIFGVRFVGDAIGGACRDKSSGFGLVGISMDDNSFVVDETFDMRFVLEILFGV